MRLSAAPTARLLACLWLALAGMAGPRVALAQPAATAAATPAAPRQFETEHRGTFGTTPLRYRASVSEYLVNDDTGAPGASVFVTSYVRTDGGMTGDRPVIFAFNGGPGSASIWLHMGVLGPVRVDQDDPAKPQTVAPFRTVPNPESPLDVADIVLIDPPGTGFSRVLPGVKVEKFYGVRQDAQATVDVIRQWLRRHRRENSPKFLLSESYGTVRAAAVAKLMAGGPTETGGMEGITLNGVMLLGQNMDMTGRAPDDDRSYINMLPTIAATACHIGKAPTGCTPESQVAVAEKFIANDYLVALHAGSALAEGERRRIAEGLSRLTGLAVPAVLASNLRISGAAYLATAAADRGQRLGAYDGRYVLPAAVNGNDAVADDPAMGQYVPAFVGALADYLRNDLKVSIDQPYQAIAFRDVFFRWDYGFGPGIVIGRNYALDLAAAMTRNPSMRLLVASGYYDFVTPLGSAKYTVMHSGVPLSATTFRSYESGHMPYLGAVPRKAFASDVRAFVRGK